MLEALGLWGALAGRAEPMERIVVTDGRVGGSELSLLEFGAGDGDTGPARLIEEPALLAALHDAVVDAARTPRFVTGSVASLEVSGSHAALVLEDGRRLAARLVVAADGARSGLRRLAGIGTVAWDYGQSGIVATVAHERGHGGVAIERFYPAGPFAVLPLTGNRSSLVWTKPSAEAKRLLALDEAGFGAELAPRFGDDRGRILAVGPRQGFPLRFQVARGFAGHRLALAGDAAHVVHPLAGQGLNLGLRDVAALAECVADAVRLGLDPGDATTLERYERWRRFDTVQMALGFDGLNRLFSNDNDSLRLARDLGLGLVQRLPPLKRLFMREAAGVTGETPRLMLGEAL
jgi:2-octaprenyl-6-methoxyphenol hydroxylase